MFFFGFKKFCLDNNSVYIKIEEQCRERVNEIQNFILFFSNWNHNIMFRLASNDVTNTRENNIKLDRSVFIPKIDTQQIVSEKIVYFRRDEL